jgi:hypothetical protein
MNTIQRGQPLTSQAKISTNYARKVIIELTNTGSLSDPEVTNSDKIHDAEKKIYLDPAEELTDVSSLS